MKPRDTAIDKIEKKLRKDGIVLDANSYAICKQSTFVSQFSWIGAGSYIGACSAIFANCHIGMSVYIEDGVTIYQNTIINDNVILGAGSSIGIGCSIGSGSSIDGHIPNGSYVGKNAIISSTYALGLEVGSVIVNLGETTKVFLPDQIMDNLDVILKCE